MMMVLVHGVARYRDHRCSSSHGALLLPPDARHLFPTPAASEKTAGALTDARAEAESVLRLDMRTAWLTWEETESRLSAAKSSLRFAEENLRVTSERYDAGLAPHTEVLDAESLRSAAEARVVHAASERIRAWLRPHQEKNHPLGLNAL